MKIPSYCLHKSSGRAFVTLNGERVYLGKYGTPESIARYERALAEHLSGSRDRSNVSSVAELLLAYLEHAQGYYANGSSELDIIKSVIRKVRKLKYDDLDVIDFRPKHLKALQQAWIIQGVSRKVINKYAQRVKTFFRWGVSEEIVPVEVYNALQTVDGLKMGRTKAIESKGVKPVDLDTVDDTLEHCSQEVRTMIKLQLLTGCRPGELVHYDVRDLDRSKDPWEYRPMKHKCSHRGKPRLICFGPQAQALMMPYVMSGFPYKHTSTYRTHIHRACDAAGIPRWSPNRLRHRAGTLVREKYGIEGAQAVLGHSDMGMSGHYTQQRLEDRAREVAAEVG